MRIASLWRYPVKGLSPEPLDAITLAAGAYVPNDRLYAIENGPSGFDTDEPRHQPKIKFLMLMRDEALARLRTRYLDADALLVIENEGREVVRADLSTAAGRLVVEAFLRRYMPKDLRGPPKVLTAPDGFRFTDSRRGFVSFINLASVRAVGELVGRTLDPLRFRGNVLVEGLAPWAEFDLVGSRLSTDNGAEFRVTKRIVRCAAINVDPTSAARDLDLPAKMMRRLGHADCGVYAEVIRGGTVAAGDVLRFVTDPQGILSLGDEPR